MIVYLIALIFLLYGSITFDFKSNNQNRREWFMFEYIVLVLISGFRYEVGGDTLVYMMRYADYPLLSQLPTLNFSEMDNGPLWYVLVALCKAISQEFYFFQIIHALIVNGAFFCFFKKHSNFPFTAVLLYALLSFFYYNTEILRASLAVSVFLLIGFDALKEKKWVLYLISIVISFGFHTEALFLLVLPLCHCLYRIRITKISLVITIAIGIVLLTFLNIMPYLQEYLNFSEAMDRRLNGYYADDRTVSFNGVIALVLNNFIWIVIAVIHKDSERFEKAFFLLFIVILIQTTKYTVFLGRVIDFVKPVLLLMLADAFWKIFKQRMYSTQIFKILLLTFTMYTGFMQYIDGPKGMEYWRRYIPYHSIFTDEHDYDRINMMYNYRNK